MFVCANKPRVFWPGSRRPFRWNKPQCLWTPRFYRQRRFIVNIPSAVTDTGCTKSHRVRFETVRVNTAHVLRKHTHACARFRYFAPCGWRENYGRDWSAALTTREYRVLTAIVSDRHFRVSLTEGCRFIAENIVKRLGFRLGSLTHEFLLNKKKPLLWTRRQQFFYPPPLYRSVLFYSIIVSLFRF